MIRPVLGFLAVLVPLAAATTAVASSDDDRTPREFLEAEGLSGSEVDQLATGKVIAKVVENEDSRELSIVSAIRVDVPREFVLSEIERMFAETGRDGVIAWGVVKGEPSAEHFAAARLPKDDLKSLSNCSLGSCDVKVTEPAFEAMQEKLEAGGGPDALNEVFASMLLQRTHSYLDGGLLGLAPYMDKESATPTREAMGILLERTTHLRDTVDEFRGYLARYPEEELESSEQLVYWVLEEFGLKPTLSLRHVVAYDPPAPLEADFIIAEMGLYASHYFQATFATFAWAEVDLGGGVAPYFFLTQRYWFDGPVTGINRSLMNRKLRGRVETQLRERRDEIVARWAEAGRSP